MLKILKKYIKWLFDSKGKQFDEDKVIDRADSKYCGCKVHYYQQGNYVFINVTMPTGTIYPAEPVRKISNKPLKVEVEYGFYKPHIKKILKRSFKP